MQKHRKLIVPGVPRTPSLSLRPVPCATGVVVRGDLVQHQTRGLRGDNDARTGMPFGIPKGAMCVQRFDDSRKFCNSHYLSHFAAFFIDARTKRSVVESFACKFLVYIVKIRLDDRLRQEFSVGPSADSAPGRVTVPAAAVCPPARRVDGAGPPKQHGSVG